MFKFYSKRIIGMGDDVTIGDLLKTFFENGKKLIIIKEKGVRRFVMFNSDDTINLDKRAKEYIDIRSKIWIFDRYPRVNGDDW